MSCNRCGQTGIGPEVKMVDGRPAFVFSHICIGCEPPTPKFACTVVEPKPYDIPLTRIIN